MSQALNEFKWDGGVERSLTTNGGHLPNGKTLQFAEGKLMDLESCPPIPIIAPQHLVAVTERDSIGAENFRSLAIRLKSFQKRRQLKRLLVTSSIKGEGKSVISANLAATLAAQERVLLIDGDMHQAGLQEVLGSCGQSGLADWWKTPEPIINFLTRVEGLSLWYLPAGEAKEDPLEILQSQKLVEMLRQVSGWFDWVIIDSPPLVPVSDSSLWAAQVDGTLLIVRRATTPRSLLKKALETEHLKLLGIVTNEWEETHQQYYGGYYGYGRRTRSVSSRRPASLPEPKNMSLPSSTGK